MAKIMYLLKIIIAIVYSLQIIESKWTAYVNAFAVIIIVFMHTYLYSILKHLYL